MSPEATRHDKWLYCEMRSDACILVFGVSGVGKTSACEAYVARHPRWVHFRASELLSQATAKDPQSLRIESANDIEANQAFLGLELQRRRVAVPGRPFIIDAHGVIDNDLGFVEVPLEAVQALGADGLILLEAPAAVVVSRRASGNRARPARSVEEIETELKAEAQAVRRFGRCLDLPIVTGIVTEGFDLAPLITALEND